VIRHSYSTVLALLLTFAAFNAARVYAQPPAQAADPAVQPPAPPSDDDDAKLRPLEPDFTVVNLPTTLPLPMGAGNFHLTHRFVGVNWRQDNFNTIASNAFGFDGPAIIQLEYRIAVMKHLEAVVARTNFGRTIQFSAKYDAFHEGASHQFGLSGIVSVEGENNFHEHNTSGADIGYSPAIGASVSRTLGNVAAVYVDPVFVHNTQDTGAADRLNTFYVGLGARLRVRPSTYVVGEVTPRMGGYVSGDAEFAFSVEKRVGGHVFSIVVANTQATTYAQLARGANPQTLYIGFNLARKFY
jgi:Membrane bound beta barrel domain (DUF5777)